MFVLPTSPASATEVIAIDDPKTGNKYFLINLYDSFIVALTLDTKASESCFNCVFFML